MNDEKNNNELKIENEKGGDLEVTLNDSKIVKKEKTELEKKREKKDQKRKLKEQRRKQKEAKRKEKKEKRERYQAFLRKKRQNNSKKRV